MPYLPIIITIKVIARTIALGWTYWRRFRWTLCLVCLLNMSHLCVANHLYIIISICSRESIWSQALSKCEFAAKSDWSVIVVVGGYHNVSNGRAKEKREVHSKTHIRYPSLSVSCPSSRTTTAACPFYIQRSCLGGGRRPSFIQARDGFLAKCKFAINSTWQTIRVHYGSPPVTTSQPTNQPDRRTDTRHGDSGYNTHLIALQGRRQSVIDRRNCISNCQTREREK